MGFTLEIIFSPFLIPFVQTEYKGDFLFWNYLAKDLAYLATEAVVRAVEGSIQAWRA